MYSHTNLLLPQEAESIKVKESQGLFTVKPASSWINQAKGEPIPEMLFGEFWYQGELCILFADTNVGKSILAVQIGDSISKCKMIRGFRLQAEKQIVLYLDFELSKKQFENRYSLNYAEHYLFDDYFIRVEINPDAVIPGKVTFEQYLLWSLKITIIATGAKILIVDNITFLGTENEKAKDALPLMKMLQKLKKKYGLSILVLAHTPKRDMSKPITKNDLQGSKMLMNFCDSSFTIGESSKDSSLRYLKQIKQRQVENIYGGENVCVCQITKPHNFLQFEFMELSTEREHLKEFSEKDRSANIEKVLELNRQGKSQRKISVAVGISLGAVNKYLKSQGVHTVHDVHTVNRLNTVNVPDLFTLNNT